MEEKREKKIRQITIELSMAWGIISWYFIFFYLNPYVYPLDFPWYTAFAYNLITVSSSISTIVAERVIPHPAPGYIAEWTGYSLSLIFQVVTYFYLGKILSWLILNIVKKIRTSETLEKQ